MATSRALQLLESVTRSEGTWAEDDAADAAARTQVALVRALVDEIRRRPDSDAAVSRLFDQLDEEVSRLARLLRSAEARSPISEIRLRA
jgi:hypothetical protein